MLAMRQQIFAIEKAPTRSMRLFLFQLATALGSIIILYTYLIGFLQTPFLILASALLATCAVPWYVKMLHSRKFAVLITTQFLSFGATIAFAEVFVDAYLSVFILSFVLFLCSFMDQVLNEKPWKQI